MIVCHLGVWQLEFVTLCMRRDGERVCKCPGACLLLAAKFSTDMKRSEIVSLIDVSWLLCAPSKAALHINSNHPTYIRILFIPIIPIIPIYRTFWIIHLVNCGRWGHSGYCNSQFSHSAENNRRLPHLLQGAPVVRVPSADSAAVLPPHAQLPGPDPL